jgi:AraC-like DNA-binding protein
MTRVRNFVADLAKTTQSVKKIKELVDEAFGDKALKKTQIYDIVRKVRAGKDASDQRSLSAKKNKRTASLIAAVAAAVEKDRRVTLQELSSELSASYGTIRRILKDELGLSKKSARWVLSFCQRTRSSRGWRRVRTLSSSSSGGPWQSSTTL